MSKQLVLTFCFSEWDPSMANVFQRMKKNVSSLYRDPYKWGFVKSVGLFLFGVYLARDLKGITLDAAGQAA